MDEKAATSARATSCQRCPLMINSALLYNDGRRTCYLLGGQAGNSLFRKIGIAETLNAKKDEVGLPQKTAGEYNCTADRVLYGHVEPFFFLWRFLFLEV
jgi:hypothetical protein